METKINFKNLLLVREPYPYMQYAHKNGYMQYYYMDDLFPAMEEYQSFKNIIKMGTNKLYHAYSLLPSNLIDKNGNPEIQLTFDQANQYIISGCLPSSDQLQKNEALRGTLLIDEDNI